MSAHTVDVHEHFAGSNRLFISVWVCLLALTGFEVFLGYKHLPIIYMLVILMGVSIVKAALQSNSLFVRNLNIGVLMLLVPPVSIFCTIFVIAIRHRKSG